MVDAQLRSAAILNELSSGRCSGETLEDAVRREILEETGLRIQPVSRFEIFERIMRDAQGKAEYHYVLADYVCKVVGGSLRAGDDVSRVEWVRRSELMNYRITEGTREVIEKAYLNHNVNHARRSST